MRTDGRRNDELRTVRITPGFVDYPEGSVLMEMGKTRVLCNATVEPGVPRWMQMQNIPGGWITGEYSMLPRATQERTPRETHGLGGRTQEIRRLIGRSLRAGVDLVKLGPRTIILDCDVIQADGGTRTAAVTGAYVAMAIALKKLIGKNEIPASTLLDPLAAISVGVVGDEVLLDLCYAEDSHAEVDVNVVMTSRYEFIEVQGTAEGKPFSRGRLDDLLALAKNGIQQLINLQVAVLVDLFSQK